MKYKGVDIKEYIKGMFKRKHGSNLTKGAFGKRKIMPYELEPGCLKVIPRSKRAKV